MIQKGDILKNYKSFKMKEIFLEMFFTYMEGNIDLSFSFSNSLNRTSTHIHPHAPTFAPFLSTITQVPSLLQSFSQLSFSI